MLDGIIIRGTTPIHEFELPHPEGLKNSEELVEDLRVIYGQKGKGIVIKKMTDCDISGRIVTVALSQEETLQFSPRSLVNIEIKVKLNGGRVVQNEEPICLRIVNTMDEEVL